MADGGMMAKGGEVWTMGEYQTIQDWKSIVKPDGTRKTEDAEGYPIRKNGVNVYLVKTKKEAIERLKRLNSTGKMADGGMMAKGGITEKNFPISYHQLIDYGFKKSGTNFSKGNYIAKNISGKINIFLNDSLLYKDEGKKSGLLNFLKEEFAKKKKAKFDYDEEALTGERAGERKAETGYADGGKISKADVETIAKQLKYDINEQDVRTIVKLYPDAQKDAPDDTWNIVVEDLIYKIKEAEDIYKKSFYNPSEAPRTSTIIFKTPQKRKMAKGGFASKAQADLDKNKNGRLDKEDFQIIRGEKKKKKMAKGGKTMRKNSPHRFCWTKDAVKDGIIKPSDMNKTPSRYQRKNYAAYIMEK